MQLNFAQHPLCHLHVLRHADAAIHVDRLDEQLAGVFAVAGGVAVEEHAGLEAAGLRLFDDVGHLLRPAKRRAKVLLGLSPPTASGGGDAS